MGGENENKPERTLGKSKTNITGDIKQAHANMVCRWKWATRNTKHYRTWRMQNSWAACKTRKQKRKWEKSITDMSTTPHDTDEYMAPASYDEK